MAQSPNRHSRRRTVASLLLACFIAGFGSVVNYTSADGRMDPPVPYPQSEGWPDEDHPSDYLTHADESPSLDSVQSGLPETQLEEAIGGYGALVSLIIHWCTSWLATGTR